MGTTLKKAGLVIAAFGITLTPIHGTAEQHSEQKAVTAKQVAMEIQENTRYLASQSLAKAKSLLEAYGDFAPFGAALFPSGKVKYVWAVKPGQPTEGVNPVLVLNSVRSALKSQADQGRILGSAVIYKFLPAGADAGSQINVELEYLTGFAQVLATQYEKTDQGYEYGEGALESYQPVVFAGNDKQD